MKQSSSSAIWYYCFNLHVKRLIPISDYRAHSSVQTSTPYPETVRALALPTDGRGVIRGEETHTLKTQRYGKVPERGGSQTGKTLLWMQMVHMTERLVAGRLPS